MNFSLITLGELLSSQNEIIKRNAFSILKQLQKEGDNGTQNPLCRHLIKHAEYDTGKLQGYRCIECLQLVPVNTQYQKNRK